MEPGRTVGQSVLDRLLFADTSFDWVSSLDWLHASTGHDLDRLLAEDPSGERKSPVASLKASVRRDLDQMQLLDTASWNERKRSVERFRTSLSHGLDQLLAAPAPPGWKGAVERLKISINRDVTRLLEDDPSSAWQRSVERLKASLHRDLEMLLNTRRVIPGAPEHLKEVRQSLYHYGLPEIATLGGNTREIRARLREELHATIAMFEPRLMRVRVSVAEPTPNDPHIRYVVRGLLCMEPTPEEIMFDAVVDPTSGDLRLEGSTDV
jgi:type VI secretion system lysozyme-like protein